LVAALVWGALYYRAEAARKRWISQSQGAMGSVAQSYALAKPSPGDLFFGLFGGQPTPYVVVKTVEVEKVVEVSQVIPQSGGVSHQAVQTRMVVYSVDMSIIVKDTQATMKQIEQLTNEVTGYVVSSQTTQYEAGDYGVVVIRVPAAELDNVLARLEGLASEVRSLNKTGTDVTEEYVDLESRVKVMEAAEQELLELYQTRQADGEVAEILEVYQQLVSFREQIESLTGRMQYLKESAAMAKVTINITPDALAQPVQIGRWEPIGTVRDAFEVLVSSGQFLVDVLIWTGIVILPLGALAGAVIYGIRRLLHRRWLRRQRAIETPPETTQ